MSMPEASTLLSQSLVESSDKAQLRDPFLVARNQYENGKMDAPSMLSQSPMQQAAPAQPKALDKLFVPNDPQDYSKFMGSELPKAMEKLGLPVRGIPLNDLGKVQLMDRLNSKFGPSYGQNPEAIQIMSLFDKALGAGTPDEQLKQSVAGGERTLKALLGGQ